MDKGRTDRWCYPGLAEGVEASTTPRHPASKSALKERCKGASSKIPTHATLPPSPVRSHVGALALLLWQELSHLLPPLLLLHLHLAEQYLPLLHLGGAQRQCGVCKVSSGSLSHIAFRCLTASTFGLRHLNYSCLNLMLALSRYFI